MITQTNSRSRGNEPTFAPIVIQRTPSEALESLLIYEIGYGGRITSVDLTRIECVTCVLNCVDTTIFEGPQHEMLLLVEAAVTALQLAVAEKDNQRYKDMVADAVISVTGGIALAIKLGAPILMGNFSVKNVMLCMIGDYRFTKQFISMPAKDAFAVLMLVKQDGVSIDEAMSLILL